MKRRRAREIAMRILYGAELGSYTAEEALERYLALEPPLRPEEFSLKLVDLTLCHRSEIDTLLSQVLQHWRLERLHSVDRALLRLGCTELLYCEDIPPKVTINEYVELTKKYGEVDSPAFVNGVLDRIAHLGPQEHLIRDQR